MKRLENWVNPVTDNDTHACIAEKFISAKGFRTKEGNELIFYRNQFYEYSSTHFQKIETRDLLVEITAFIIQFKTGKRQTTLHTAKNVAHILSALVKIPSDLKPGTFINKECRSNSFLFGVKNGIFDIEKFLANENPLAPHSVNFLSFFCLPFEYDPKKRCPVWIGFIETSFPDKDLREFIQEWFGYSITPSTSFHKFALWVGSGANGKSVACTVLRTLVGEENTSSIPLEQFDTTRTFPLGGLVDKIANITEEIGETDRVAEDVLKNIVSGGMMSVEKKHQDPILVRFTAKLTFATNVVPRFRDRSDGLWRRLLIVPFKAQFLDPKKQNKNLVDPAWWSQSGEMEGILNWSLTGLARLIQRGRFEEPAASRAMLEEFRTEANPATTFLLENFEISEGGNLSSITLYRAYSEFMKLSGSNPLGRSLFTREVKLTFKEARLSKNARTTGRFRARVWENLRHKPDLSQDTNYTDKFINPTDFKEIK